MASFLPPFVGFLIWAAFYPCSSTFAESISSMLPIYGFPCTPNFCENVFCRPITHCSSGQILPKASFCGCCDRCISYQDENEPCDNDDARPYAVKRRICKHLLKCVNGLCVRGSFSASCSVIAKWRKALKDDSFPEETTFSSTIWIPDCDEDGKYKSKQCKKEKCLCSDENGKTLFGQEQRALAANMTCGCSRVMAKLKNDEKEHWMTNVQERCSKTGDFNQLQCIKDLCYCSDPITGNVNGQVTKIAFRSLLPCYNRKEFSKYHMTQCEKQLMRTRSLMYQFHRKNIEIIGLEHVQCDVDGTFAAKQCTTDKCVCTNRKGIGIGSYAVEKRVRDQEINMKCKCARDQHDKDMFHMQYPRMICDAGGNFEYRQCFGLDNCYCVDEDGDFITSQMTDEIAKNVNCKELLNYINDIENISM